MNITKENLIATRYIDPDQTMIDIIIKDDQGNQQSIAVNADPNNETFQSLLEVKNLAQLQESHDNFVDQESERNRRMDAWYMVHKFTPEQLDFIASADEVSLANIDIGSYIKEDTSLPWKRILENTIEEDQLFKLKLLMFEDDAIKNSKKSKQKSNLRRATTVAEIFYYYALIKGIGGK